MSTMLEAALDLAAAGWSVFPCRESGDRAKSPYTIHGHLEASQDVDAIHTWWKRWPGAMIGGPVPDSLVVLDIDPRNGGSLDALTAELGPLPLTLTAWSGRGDGGRHLYFERPTGTLFGRHIPKGVDLKANGYCILPPSVHPSTGQPYTWDYAAIAALPVAAKMKMRRPVRVPLPRTPLSGSPEALVMFLDRFPVNGINDALYWAACRATESGSLDTIAEQLIDRAVHYGESDHAARLTVESARNKIGGPR